MAAANPLLFAAAIGALVVFGLLLALLFVYINSVMRFILFDSVVEKRCRIRQGWHRRQPAGWRYFGWQILLFLASAVGLTILLGVPAAFGLAMGWLAHPGDHVLALVLGGIVLFFLLGGFLVSLGVVAVLTKDFVVPQMAIEDIGAFEAWRRLLSMMNREKLGYARLPGNEGGNGGRSGCDHGHGDLHRFSVDSDPRGWDRRGRGARGKSRRAELESLYHYDCGGGRQYARRRNFVCFCAYLRARDCVFPGLLGLLFRGALPPAGCPALSATTLVAPGPATALAASGTAARRLSAWG
jgi:hypothetical protein